MNRLNRLLNVIKGCTKGASCSQTELYALYHKSVYNSCYRILGDRIESEEVMHDTFLKVFDKINEYLLSPQRLEYSLKRIAVNASIDVVRRRKGFMVDVDDIADIDQMDEQEVDDHTDVDMVKKIIAALPEGYRLVLTLKLSEGLTTKQIAEQLGISEVAVRSQFSRAKQRVIEEYRREKDEKVR